MRPSSRRWLAVCLSLAAAALACARAEVPLTPAQPQVSTPAVGGKAPEATATSAAEPTTAGYPAPASPEPAAPTPEGGYPAPAGSTPEGGYPAPTSVIQLPPTATPPPTDTPPPTETPAPTNTPAPTDTRAPLFPTLPPTFTAPAPATAAAPTTAPSGGTTPVPTAASGGAGRLPLPGGVTLSQAFSVAVGAGVVIGRPEDLADGRLDTWASLRGGSGVWVLTLENAQTVAGVRLYAQRDGSDPTTLTRIEVSADGSAWTTVYTGQGNCGAAQCDTLPQKEYSEFGFGAATARLVRLTSGPTRFAFGEVEIAVVP